MLNTIEKLNSEKSKLNDLAEIIFRETTTLGVRFYETARFKLERKNKNVKTKYGNIDVKIGKHKDAIYNIMPEYESIRGRAKQKVVPIKEVYNNAIKSY